MSFDTTCAVTAENAKALYDECGSNPGRLGQLFAQWVGYNQPKVVPVTEPPPAPTRRSRKKKEDPEPDPTSEPGE